MQLLLIPASKPLKSLYSGKGTLPGFRHTALLPMHSFFKACKECFFYDIMKTPK